MPSQEILGAGQDSAQQTWNNVRNAGAGNPDRRSRGKAMALHIDSQMVAGIPTVYLQGDFDLDSAPRVRMLLESLTCQEAPAIRVHLGHLDCLDSVGLGVLVAGLKQALDPKRQLVPDRAAAYCGTNAADHRLGQTLSHSRRGRSAGSGKRIGISRWAMTPRFQITQTQQSILEGFLLCLISARQRDCSAALFLPCP